MSFNDARIRAYERHGIWLLVVWFPIGFYLLATQRYYKKRWLLMHHLHNALGLFVTLVTLVTSLQAYAYVDWKQKANPHSVLGLIALILTIFVGVTGLVTSGMMHCYKGDADWKGRDKVYNVAKVHRWAGYVMLLLGNGVCSGGIATYFTLVGFGVWGTFGLCSSIIFLTMWVVHEYFLRRYNRKHYKII